MSNLPRPTKCNKCNSLIFLKASNPERWLCENGHIIVSREVIIHGVCKCGAKKSDGVPFKENKNQCMECYHKYMVEYWNNNKEKLNQYKRGYYADNHDRLRQEANAYYTSTPEIFMGELFRRAKRLAKRRINSPYRKVPFEFNLTTEYLIGLWNMQKGKCAITDVNLVHKYGYMTTASVDRIDSDKGYIIGNVQLVCKGINLMKSDYSQQEANEFLSTVSNKIINKEVKNVV